MQRDRWEVESTWAFRDAATRSASGSSRRARPSRSPQGSRRVRSRLRRRHSLVAREDGKRMAAGSAGDHDLQVRLLSHRARVARAFFEAAETAPRRGRAFSCRVFVHGTALYAGLALRTCRSSAAHDDSLVSCGRSRGGRRRHRARSGRAPDRRSAPLGRVFRTLCRRFERAVEADYGPLGYLLERAGRVFGLPGRSGRRAYRGLELSVRARSTRGPAPVAFLQFHAARRLSVPIERGRTCRSDTREGFFVVEARRGDVGEQVWINRSRIGIVSKETPSGLLVYGADLGTGMPLARMRVQFVVNRSFVTA